MEMNGTTVIRRPSDAVYAYVMDVSNDANWRTGVDESRLTSEEPVTIGTEGYTIAGNAKAVWRVISYSEGKNISWEFISGPFEGRGGYRLVPVDGGTEFTLVADIVPTNWLRYLGPIFTWIGQRQNQADVERLREILESEAGDRAT